jgi:hypothetical protein
MVHITDSAQNGSFKGETISIKNAPGFYGAGQTRNETVNQYKYVLNAVYNRPLTLHSDHMGHLITEASGILEIAERLGCIHTVQRTLDSLIVEYGQVLWQSIGQDPFAWIDLALRIGSYNLLKDVAVHMVGQWSMMSSSQKTLLPQKLRSLCETKHLQLEEEKKHIEMNLNAYYPDKMKRDKTEIGHRQSRGSYGNDIIEWMCANVFRQWLAAKAIRCENRTAPDGGFEFYSVIHKGGDAYLDKEAMNWFHGNFAMGTRGQNNLKGHLEGFKNGVKHLVAPLMVNNSSLDLSKRSVKYLTCAKFSRPEILNLYTEGDTLDWGDKINIRPRGKKRDIQISKPEEDTDMDEKDSIDDNLPDAVRRLSPAERKEKKRPQSSQGEAQKKVRKIIPVAAKFAAARKTAPTAQCNSK